MCFNMAAAPLQAGSYLVSDVARSFWSYFNLCAGFYVLNRAVSSKVSWVPICAKGVSPLYSYCFMALK
jgi:hypothetical protein